MPLSKSTTSSVRGNQAAFNGGEKVVNLHDSESVIVFSSADESRVNEEVIAAAAVAARIEMIN